MFFFAFAFTLMAIALISSASSSYNLRAREILSPPIASPIKAPYEVPSSFKMYRQSLDARGKALYDAIENGIRELDPVISISEGTTNSEIENILEYVMNDNPDIFWTGMEYSITSQWGHPMELCPEYLWTEDEIRVKMSRYDAIADDIISRLPDVEDPHIRMDEICRHVAMRAIYEYDEERTAECQNIDSVFTNGVSVCAGYARAVQFVALKSGLRCSYVSGNAFFHEKLGPHAWNVLYDDRGNASYYDSTWGDGDIFGYERFWSARPFEVFPLHEPDFATVIPRVV